MGVEEKNDTEKREMPVQRPMHEFYMPAMPPFGLCKAIARGVRTLYRYMRRPSGR